MRQANTLFGSLASDAILTQEKKPIIISEHPYTYKE